MARRFSPHPSTSSSSSTTASTLPTEPLLEEEEDVVLLPALKDEDAGNDLSYWELINPSDADSDDDSLHSLENEFVSWYSLSPSSPPKPPSKTDSDTATTETLHSHQPHDSDLDSLPDLCDAVHRYELGPLSNSITDRDDGVDRFDPGPPIFPALVNRDHGGRDLYDWKPEIFVALRDKYLGNDYDNQDEEVEEDEDDDGYPLDDELVPRHLSSKLGRQRMRKLGKRGFGKMMSNAKRNPYRYVKPGAVYGKHGLGMKA